MPPKTKKLKKSSGNNKTQKKTPFTILPLKSTVYIF